jgi:hypothetical protein
MDSFIPSKLYSGLTDDRLAHVASLMRAARHSVVEIHDPTKGDNAWTMGCLSYQRECFAIIQESKTVDYLRLVPEDHGKFTFSIGGWPVKFYHGDGDDPPSKALAVSHAEFRQLKLALEIEQKKMEEYKLRIAIETDSRGELIRAILVRIDEAGEPESYYVMPFERSTVLEMKAPPIDPGRPEFGALNKDDEKEKRNDGDVSAAG